MKKTEPSISALAKQCQLLEEKIIKAKFKKMIAQERAIARLKAGIKRAKAQLATAKQKQIKTKAQQSKIMRLTQLIIDQQASIVQVKADRHQAKIDYQEAVVLRKIREKAANDIQKSKKKSLSKQALGRKIKAKTVTKSLVVDKHYLGIDTSQPVSVS